MTDETPTRLCFATPQFYPTYGGSHQRYLRYLPGFREQGLAVRVFAGTATDEKVTRGDAAETWRDHKVGTMLAEESVNGTPVHRLRLPTSKGPYRRWTFSRGLDRFCHDPATRPDVVQLLGTIRVGAIPWVKRLQGLGIPTLYSVTTASKTQRKKKYFDRRLFKFRLLFNSMDCVVTNSGAVGDALREMNVSTRIEVIPNGVDLARFSPASSPETARSVREELGIGASARLVIAVGAVMPRKGSDLLLDAFLRTAAQDTNVHLVFAGPRYDIAQAEKSEFRDRMGSLLNDPIAAGRVHFLGIVEDVPRYLQAADVCVLASKLEGMPNSVLEAMACGIPVVVTPFVGLSDDLGRADREFRLCERSPEALAATLTELIGDPAARTTLGTAGRCWVEERLPLNASVTRHVELYEELVAEYRARSSQRR
jgi:glycosyltransferase involved in cell wall biosynthesis